MAVPLGSATLDTTKVNTFYTGYTVGLKGVLVSNFTGYGLTVQLENGTGKSLNPGTQDFFAVPLFYSGVVFFQVTFTPPNIKNLPGGTIIFDGVTAIDNISPSSYPVSLAASQAVSPTASGKPLFTASFGSTATVAATSILNVFNPSTSGVVYNFYSCILYTDDATAGATRPTLYVAYLAGADLNFANAVTVASHIGSPTPPTTNSHATYGEQAGLPASTTIIEHVIYPQPTQEYEVFTFPDNYQLFPGGQLWCAIVSAASGHNNRHTLKWSEG